MSAPAAEACTQEAQVHLNLLHDRLLRIGNNRFLFSRIYAGLQRPMFETTHQAITAISRIPAQKANRTKLCFQRSLLAAKVSKSFAHGGVLLIGAQLATSDMHAWIIEQNTQPDYQDRSWINYRPLLAITAR
jgi:hypothetical protein